MDEAITLLDLPNEMILEILRYLPFKDRISLSSCNEILYSITKDSIEKDTNFKLHFPFPDLEMVSKLMRGYETMTMRYSDFIHEEEKTKAYLDSSNCKPKCLLLNIFMDSFEINEIFEKFIQNNQHLKSIKINFHNNEVIDYISSKLPQIELHALKVTQSLSNPSSNFNPKFVENLEVFNSEGDEINEIDLIKILNKFRNIKRFRTYHLKSSERVRDATNLIKELNLESLNLERLDLYYAEEISESSPILSLFKNLKSFMCHFQNDEIEYSEDSFKFAHKIYTNNANTLKVLSLKVFGVPQLKNLLPTSSIGLEELHFFSCDTDEPTKSFLIQILTEQSENLKKLYLECLNIDEEIFLKITSLEKLETISFRTCEIDFNGSFNISPKNLRLSFSSISFNCFKTILKNESFSRNIEILHLDDFQITSSTSEDDFEDINFPNLKSLVYRTYGEGDEVHQFIRKLKAQSLEKLKYGFVWETPPSFQKFSKLKVLVVEPLYKNFENVNLLTNLENLEILELFVDLNILGKTLERVLSNFNFLKLCKIKCHSKQDKFEEMSKICEKIVLNKIYKTETFIKENFKFVKIINLKLTVYVHMEIAPVLYYYGDFFNNLFEF